MCLAGERYRGRLEARLRDMVERYGVRMFKLDGMMEQCMAPDHGHEPGPLASEDVADGAIKTFASVRKAAPNLWLECTAWGGHASPWWLFHFDSVMGCVGDDIVFGRVPSPVYRESYTTSRDFYCLQGMAHSSVPIPFQDTLGLVHQTDEDFLNDGVNAFMRGNKFVSLYVNPSFMNDTRWKNMAGLIAWARKNAPVLEKTEPLQPASWLKSGVPPMTGAAVMPREPYGFAHWTASQGLVEIRNPWIQPASYALKLDRSMGTPAGISGFTAVSLYPEVRLYGRDLKAGDTLNIPLAPYETVVLSLAPQQVIKGMPAVAEVIGGRIRIAARHSEMKRIDPSQKDAMSGKAAGAPGQNEYANREIKPDEGASDASGLTPWTNRLGRNAFATKIKLDADLFTTTTQAQLLILLEGGKAMPKYAYQLKVNGRDYNMDAHRSVTNSHPYNLGTGSSPEPQWVFLQARLPQDATTRLEKGNNQIALELVVGDNCSKVSAWVCATKPGGFTPEYPNVLPSPEMISVDGAALMDPVELKTAPVDTAKK